VRTRIRAVAWDPDDTLALQNVTCLTPFPAPKLDDVEVIRPGHVLQPDGSVNIAR
jgi:hypothetical protein